MTPFLLYMYDRAHPFFTSHTVYLKSMLVIIVCYGSTSPINIILSFYYFKDHVCTYYTLWFYYFIHILLL